MPELKYFVEDRHATWLELFFDLVFVASISVITHHLTHVHGGHLAGQQVMLFISEFIPVWWIWATHTLYANRFDTDSKTHRVTSLVIMFLMTTLSAFLGAGLFDGSTRFISFYIAIRLVQAGMYFSTSYRLPESQPYAKWMGMTVLGGMAISLLALFFSSPLRQLIFLGSIGLEMIAIAQISTQRTVMPVHCSHLVERIGLLSIILLGESVISLVSGLSGLEWNQYDLFAAVTGFLMIGAIWWIYFDSFNIPERAKRIQ